MYNFETNQDILDIIEKCSDKEKLVDVYSFVWEECQKNKFHIEDYKWKSLANHISAMVERAHTKGEFEGIEVEMFNEISSEALSLAKAIVDKIENLHENEMYLLSVHFEAAK